MPAKKSAITPPTPSPAAAKKAPAKKAPAAKTTAKTAAKAATKATTSKAAATPSPVAAQPSREQIEHAAFLNYRRRKDKNLPGDAHGDWLDAERKLQEL